MTDPTDLRVTNVTSQGESATIEFEDGHRVVFEGYSHGFGYQVEGLRHFFLFNGEEQVVQYDSRLRRVGPSEDEHRFVQVAEGYDLERIAAYWEAARKYLNDEYFEKPYQSGTEGDPNLWFPWKVSGEGWMDLSAIKEGRKELPEPSSVGDSQSSNRMPSSHDDGLLAGFGLLMSAFGGGGDSGNMFPASDAEDLALGARFIPGEVTMARREGQKVTFNQPCNACCWYWEFPDGTRVYHFDQTTYNAIGRVNNPDRWGEEGVKAGPCPNCGNEHTGGGTVEATTASS